MADTAWGRSEPQVMDPTTTNHEPSRPAPAGTNRRLRVLLPVAAVALAAAGWYLWRQHAEENPFGPLVLSGNVDVHQVELAFRVTGRIVGMSAQEGDAVRPGDTLAELDPVPFRQDLAAARADVGQAQAQYDKTRRGFRSEEIAQARAAVEQRAADLGNARVTLERQQNLVAAGLVTHQQIDDAEARVHESEAQLDAARAQLKLEERGSRIEDIETQRALLAAAQARLERADTALSDTRLTAPSAGIISVRAREPGAMVQAGQTVYTLTLSQPVWIRAYVPQPRLGRIKPGMAVKVEIDSMPGRQYDATVGFISPDAEFTPKTVQTEQVRDDLVYRIRVIANDPDNVFRQGMPVTVRVPAARPAELARSR
ncbi:MAG TPA: HlyD family efflux transporter periplasmic adaptor subunit [Steroidobacteraceae bacterium]|nr:HlyD family efflux transporter periplasmic adaptor subunit [Steroidobacteraceae bacterium]